MVGYVSCHAVWLITGKHKCLINDFEIKSDLSQFQITVGLSEVQFSL